MLNLVHYTILFLTNGVFATFSDQTNEFLFHTENKNYMNHMLSNMNTNIDIILQCDIDVNTEFLQNSTHNQQLFSFACFFQNILCQALCGEDKYAYTPNGAFISDLMPQNIQKYSHDIDFTFEERNSRHGWYEQSGENELVVKSHCFIILPCNEMHRVQKYVQHKDLEKKVTFLNYVQGCGEQQAIEAVREKVADLTNNLIDFNLDKNNFNGKRIYVSILYFKGTWQNEFNKISQPREFKTIEQQKIMRKYIELDRKFVRHMKYSLSCEQLIDVFILPFYNNEGNRFKAIYLSPSFDIKNNMELKTIYLQFLNKFTVQKDGRHQIDESKFRNIKAHIFIPEFDQTCKELNLIKLLPQTYQQGPALSTETMMKLRVKIDENGVEGAAICSSICTDGIDRNPIITINVEKPYIVLIYDEKLQQSLFTIKDTGINAENQ